MSVKTSHNQKYIEWLYHSRFFAEPESKPVPFNYKSPRKWPKGALGYRFYERQIVESDGELLAGKRRNVTPWVYRGVEYTLDEVRQLQGDYHVLITNMECNDWDRVVFAGGMQGPAYPLLHGERVVAP